ncbi:MAG TPA: cysteine desulfurase family protein [Dehalococcoidales bacterium]
MRKAYLDHSATAPVLPEVRDAMLPYLGDKFGNPSSLHDWGDPAREAIDAARSQVATLVGASDPEEVIFTASGTESNNFAIKGIAMAQQSKGKHIVISAIEHFSVMNSAKALEKMGFEVTLVPVDKFGIVNPEDVSKSLRQDTILVSIMQANGEVGTIEPIREIAKITKERKIVFHTDAVATCGTIPVNVKELGVDVLSLAGNQFYGPKGSGALWVRRGVRIVPLLEGGIQEGGRRAGTEDVPAIVGMGKAAEIAVKELSGRIARLIPMRDKLLTRMPDKVGHVIVTGHPQNRLPGHASFCVEFIEGESMLMMLNAQGIAVSSGSSCTSRALKASHVLLAMGYSHEIAQGSLLFTIGIENSIEDIDYVIEVMPSLVDRLRQMSPLYAKFVKAGKGGQ